MQNILDLLLQQSIQQSPYNNNGSAQTTVAPRRTPPDLVAALQGIKRPYEPQLVETDSMFGPASFPEQDINLMNEMDQQYSSEAKISQPQPMEEGPRELTSQSIQEWLGAKAPTEGGLIENILKSRSRPTMNDWGSALATTVNKGTLTTPQAAADERLTGALSKLADIQKLSTTGTGGATGALVQQYMDSTGSDFPTALYAVQTGMRQGLGYNNGMISALPGVPEAKGNIAYGEQMGKNTADVGTARAEAYQTDIGQQDVINQTLLPNQINNIDNMVKVVDDALAHPGFDANFGMTGLVPNRPGSEASDAATYINQLRGKAFLNEIPQMKGSGALSDAEGQKLEQAAIRLSNAQSPESARIALADIRQILVGNRQRTSARLGNIPTDQSVPLPPQPNNTTTSGFSIRRID